MDDRRILIAHGRVPLPGPGREPVDLARLVTVMTNLTYYGYALTHEGVASLAAASAADLEAWWLATEEALMAITGDDKNMDDHVVYKNFPAEVLAMDEADYWARQILMYWGLPNEWFTEAEAPRKALDEDVALKVLQRAEETSLGDVYRAHLRRPVRWTSGQWDEVSHLAGRMHGLVPVADVPFKENQVRLAAHLIDCGVSPKLGTATDVLRLAVAMSGGDVALREPSKLRGFKRRERRVLLDMLEAAKHLDADVARRRERFKRLFRALRPGDYADRCPRVVAIYDKLYRGEAIPTFERELEHLIAAKDPGALRLLSERPGVLMRRLHECLLRLGTDAAGTFVDVIPKLTTAQLLKVLRHLETDHERRTRCFAPRGNWSKLQTRPNDPARRIPKKLRKTIVGHLEEAIAARVTAEVPSVWLDPRVADVKLQTNDSDLSPHGRGTRFPIPDRITFVRTASYWASGPTRDNLWYDNGWSFYDAAWTPKGVCCWTSVKFADDAALFSGDPTNSKVLDGRACQLIDLYLDRLVAEGVRYAVWNILCYSRKSFDDAKEVHAALMWGEKAEEGKLFEPSRCQLSFPVRGDNMTKYIAALDLERRQMIYLDANLYGKVHTAAANTKVIGAIMPAFFEYLDALPSVHDLFRNVPQHDTGMTVAYDDAERTIAKGEQAYVFRPLSQDNDFTPFDLGTLLG
ncbi:MAG: hypothetical protein RIF41_12810 [Polyangiaceae bacterium]